MKASPTRIVIADDHPMLVEGIQSLLSREADMTVIAVASNARELVTVLRSHPADFVLMDLSMPGPDTLETLHTIRISWPQIKILIFTSYFRPELVKETRQAGADGYVVKNVKSSELKQAIREIMNGGQYFSSSLAQKASLPLADTDSFIKKHQITAREKEIIALIAEGHSTRQIADTLQISELTVNAHRRNICRKLGIENPVAIVNFARENGLL